MKNEIIKLYPDFNFVYGPYKRKDGRMHIVLYDGKIRKTISYPKALMEVHIGRILIDDETVDHKDENFDNNDISNLRIISRSKNSKRSAKRLVSIRTNCVLCGCEFTPSPDQMKRKNRSYDNDVAGPFCSRTCSGRYTSMLRNGLISKLERTDMDISYYKESEFERF